MCVTIFRFRLHIFQVQDYYNVQVDGWDTADVWTRPALDTRYPPPVSDDS